MLKTSAIVGALALATTSALPAQAATIFAETVDGVTAVGTAGAGQTVARFAVGEGEVGVLGDSCDTYSC